MAKKEALKNKKLVRAGIISVALILFFIGFFLLRQNSQTQIPSDPYTAEKVQYETYNSEFLKITFDYPEQLQVESKSTNLILKNENGEIMINRIGTNFKTVDEYLSFISEEHNFQVRDKQNHTINSMDAISFIKKLNTASNTEKTYYFYPTSWTIYSLTTSSEALYDDLDQIANSFRYTP